VHRRERRCLALPFANRKLIPRYPDRAPNAGDPWIVATIFERPNSKTAKNKEKPMTDR